jgi:hypothetical protein
MKKCRKAILHAVARRQQSQDPGCRDSFQCGLDRFMADSQWSAWKLDHVLRVGMPEIAAVFAESQPNKDCPKLTPWNRSLFYEIQILRHVFAVRPDGHEAPPVNVTLIPASPRAVHTKAASSSGDMSLIGFMRVCRGGGAAFGCP